MVNNPVRRCCLDWPMGREAAAVALPIWFGGGAPAPYGGRNMLVSDYPQSVLGSRPVEHP